jgi:hypothetical protein
MSSALTDSREGCPRYSAAELIQLRRQMLRSSRSIPPGPERNERRQIAASLLIRAAGLRDELSFASFRHGDFSETGDAGLTDREIVAQGRKATIKTLPKYVKRTTKHIVSGTKKRRAARTKDGHRMEN